MGMAPFCVGRMDRERGARRDARDDVLADRTRGVGGGDGGVVVVAETEGERRGGWWIWGEDGTFRVQEKGLIDPNVRNPLYTRRLAELWRE